MGRGGLRSAFPGDEVVDQVSVQGPQNLFYVLCDPDGWRGKGYRWGGIKKKKEGTSGGGGGDKEVFHLKNECMLQTQEGPQRTREWDETTKSLIISSVNRSVYLPPLSPSAGSSLPPPPPSLPLNQTLIVPLAEPVVLIRGLAQTSLPSTCPSHTHTHAPKH